eukprot:1681486-Rhodomonas_salina.1
MLTSVSALPELSLRTPVEELPPDARCIMRTRDGLQANLSRYPILPSPHHPLSLPSTSTPSLPQPNQDRGQAVLGSPLPLSVFARNSLPVVACFLLCAASQRARKRTKYGRAQGSRSQLLPLRSAAVRCAVLTSGVMAAGRAADRAAAVQEAELRHVEAQE